MSKLSRRELLLTAASLPALSRAQMAQAKTRVALVHSTHAKLARPSSPEDPLDYERVRDMVWSAIRYAQARAGSLEQKIPAGAWVVIKPNIVGLRGRENYRTGDITDFRVTRAVFEYVARYTRAGCVTLAEGGSYRRLSDPAKDNVIFQGDTRTDAHTFDWGREEFPGFAGSMGDMLGEFRKDFPAKRYDYVDLSYDAVRDSGGNFRRLEVKRTPGGVGAFGARPDYFVTNTILGCDFLISVPVMKVHLQAGMTGCLKNYVGTAPREAYAVPGTFHNAQLHSGHSVDNRIDPFIVDLASFHPPDYSVVDGLRGLQYEEHSNGKVDQMVRSNLILAGEDPVATDALIAHLLGYNVWDMEFLHMAAKRGIGVRDLAAVDVLGDEPGKFERRWAKPRNWYGRANRLWRVTAAPDAPAEAWKRYESPTDTLVLDEWNGKASATGDRFAAAARIRAAGNRKGFLWIGATGRFEALLNGERVMAEQGAGRYRVGQFQEAVELQPGENQLLLKLEATAPQPRVSALLVGPRNDGDSVEGIEWLG